MTDALRWRHAEPELRALVEAWWSTVPAPGVTSELVDESAYRRAVRVSSDTGAVLVKHFRSGTGPHRLRERTKSALGLSAAHREWRGLSMLARAGLSAPRGLGLARTADGDTLVIIQWVDAPTLWQLLDRLTDDRRPPLMRVAEAVAALHAAGLAHGDLHPGNVLMAENGPVFVDLQRVRRARPSGRRQRRDLGLLDYSLRQLGVSRTDRLRVLQRALSLTDAQPAARRAGTRAAVGQAERTSTRQTRARARRGRSPAPGAHWGR